MAHLEMPLAGVENKPGALQAGFASWLQSLRADAPEATGVEQPILPVDGKTARRSHDRKKGLGALHSVSIWASEFGLSLGQVSCEEKSNEITAIPLLLQQLALGGCSVTIDAMGTQTKIAEQIIEQEGDYALALKDNQVNLYDEVQATFTMAEQEAFATVACESDRTVEKAHGRLEIREYWTISDPAILEYLDPEKRWKGLRGIGMVRAERRIAQKITKETRYFLLSFSSVKTCVTRPRSRSTVSRPSSETAIPADSWPRCWSAKRPK